VRAEALSTDGADGYFAAMYARVTERVDQAIAAGRFGDGDGMAEFARTFADWYVGPRQGSRQMPACWQATLDVADDDTLLIVQHLLLAFNAHINYDLPQVVVELVGGGRSLDSLRPDFDAINDILAETQSDIVRDLGRVSGWTHWAAGAGGGRLFAFSLDRAREQAWATAVRLRAMDESARSVDVAELDRIVSALAFMITRQSAPIRWLLRIPRWLEIDDPTEVTRRLLGHLA
jgi:hypothetical protein